MCKEKYFFREIKKRQAISRPPARCIKITKIIINNTYISYLLCKQKYFFRETKKAGYLTTTCRKKYQFKLLTCIKKRTHRIFIVQRKIFFSSRTTQPYTQPYTQHHIHPPRKDAPTARLPTAHILILTHHHKR